MKTQIIILLLFSGLLGCSSSGLQESNHQGRDQKSESFFSVIDSYPLYDLTDQQKNDLQYMWEEEKLARDVYLYLYDLWGSRIFENISGSEQTHMDAIGALLQKYEIIQLTDGSGRGNFSMPELQSLYNELILRGQSSEYEAFLVGKSIEEIDIADLQSRMNSSYPDASAVFSNLLEGSYRHLSAFNRQLD